jgi:hypothetical protein
MPVQDFNGETFVAFMDISGFKEMMKDEHQAVKALGTLYQTGFDVLRDNNDINGFFISDCGILFIRNTTGNFIEQLNSLLNIIERINRRLLTNDIMLTTSIAYGSFTYHQRIEFTGIEKNPIYGNAYVTAFLDNEKRKPKIQPGECRILLSEQLKDRIEQFERIEKLKRKGNYCYFYWMVNHEEEINNFEQEYNNAYKRKYSGMLGALKQYGLTNHSA